MLRGSFGIALAIVLSLGPATEPAGAVETAIGSKEMKLHELVKMVDRGVLFHSDLSGMAGEVVGSGPTVDAVFTLFMGSADHRDILLGAGWTRSGIGVVRGPGRIWVTQLVKG